MSIHSFIFSPWFTVHFRDPLGANVAVKNLRVCLQDVHSRPPQPTLARKFLNESVSNAINDNTTTLTFGKLDAFIITFLNVSYFFSFTF